MIVLQAIAGPDARDRAVPESVPIAWDATRGRHPRRVGYLPSFIDAETDPDRRANNERAIAALEQLGCTLVPLQTFPSGDLSYFIEYTERAAAFDSLVATGLHKGVSQRTGRFLRAGQLMTAVDYLQANRRRASIMQEVARLMREVEVVMFTALTLDSRTSLNPLMSLTGHPSVAVPNGFASTGSPAGVMFSGHLYREGEVIALAKAFQDQNRQHEKLPPLFAAS